MITPVILTFNEELNLNRALESLAWAKRTIILDSGSTDGTLEIAERRKGVSVFSRRFDDFGRQWEFALRETEIDTPWVLALDADMAVSADLAREIEAYAERGDVDGGVLAFEYRIEGVRLASSLYPAQLRLFRKEKVSAASDGHAHSFRVSGRVERLRGRLIHDDRKPLESFANAQLKYSEIEATRIGKGTTRRPVRSFIRSHLPFGPLLAWGLAYVRAGGPFVGPAASRYAAERLLYETMLRHRLDTCAVRRAIDDSVSMGGDI